MHSKLIPPSVIVKRPVITQSMTTQSIESINMIEREISQVVSMQFDRKFTQILISLLDSSPLSKRKVKVEKGNAWTKGEFRFHVKTSISKKGFFSRSL